MTQSAIDTDEVSGTVPEGEPEGDRTRYVRTFVLLFSSACLIWVLRPLIANGRELAASVEGGHLLGRTAAGALAYAALSVLNALAWWWLAGLYGCRPTLRRGYEVFARSQVAKYLPGNIFHYVSRQLLGRRAGLSHTALVASSILEMASMLTAAAALILLASGTTYLPDHDHHLVWLASTGGILVLVFGWRVMDTGLRRFGPTAPWFQGLPRLRFGDAARLFGPTLVFHISFAVGVGGILWALVSVIAPETAQPSFLRVVGIFPLAWMAGTVTLGAPAGVGVREAVLTWQLGTLLTPAQAAATALALRLVTLSGDLLTALAGWLQAPRPPVSGPAS
ncbi:MAG: flippase-like domain-containing protein [Thermoanaerobaculia bacterium]|nr:flippase-like domain-containing protein [Thermoanaerobaculia bacterium]